MHFDLVDSYLLCGCAVSLEYDTPVIIEDTVSLPLVPFTIMICQSCIAFSTSTVFLLMNSTIYICDTPRYLHVCICVYIYVHVNIFEYVCRYMYINYIQVHTCVYVCIYMYICIFLYILIYMSKYVYTLHTGTYMCICVYAHMYIYIYLYSIYGYIYMNICVYE